MKKDTWRLNKHPSTSLSNRIILDTAYSRNMGGSWARDWENLFRSLY
ncbi:hypothetical protein U0070_020999, partial [Myodes glareolus]